MTMEHSPGASWTGKIGTVVREGRYLTAPCLNATPESSQTVTEDVSLLSCLSLPLSTPPQLPLCTAPAGMSTWPCPHSPGEGEGDMHRAVPSSPLPYYSLISSPLQPGRRGERRQEGRVTPFHTLELHNSVNALYHRNQPSA